MAAARLTPTGTRLQAVRDEDLAREPETCSVCRESSWRVMHAGICDSCRVRYPAHLPHEQLTFHGDLFVPLPRTPRTTPKLARRPRRCAATLKVRPSGQLTLALDHLRSFARVKGYSLGTGRLTNKEKAESKQLRPFMLRQVPKKREDCVDGPRPCNVARCRHNLYITVNPDNGSIKLNFPNKLPGELEYTCSLDAADEHHETGMTLERVGELNGLSLERVRQVEASGLQKLKARLNPDALRALFTRD